MRKGGGAINPLRRPFQRGEDIKSKTDLKFEIKVSIFVLVIAIAYVVIGFLGIEDVSGKFMTQAILKPTTFPRIIGGVFIVSGLIMLFQALLNYTNYLAEEKKMIARGEPLPVEKKKERFPVKEALPILIGFIVYIAVLRQLGFILDTIILSLAGLFYLNRKNWIRNIIFSVIFTIIVWYVFNDILTIYLPRGVIFGGH